MANICLQFRPLSFLTSWQRLSINIFAFSRASASLIFLQLPRYFVTVLLPSWPGTIPTVIGLRFAFLIQLGNADASTLLGFPDLYHLHSTSLFNS